MKGQGIINSQLDLIEKSVNEFVSSLPQTERAVYDRVLELVKQLDVRAGLIESNANNLRLIARIKGELDRIVISNDYARKVSEFTAVFDRVGNLNENYFAMIAQGFRPKPLLDEIKRLNIETTISDLTENGIGSAYIDGIRDLLETNITTGARYSDMVDDLRTFIKGKDGEDGTMVKYAKQIATDSLNQYNGQYIKAVTNDLKLEWYQYVGSNIKTTRPFCKALTEKRWVHESEIPTILNGNIDGKKVSLAGLYPNTNRQNFFQLRGGYNCGHQLYPVLTSVVPESVRARIKS